jgi:cell division septation protein DedD
MKKKDYSDTGQRSESDELFEEIFQLARKRDQKTKKAATSQIKVTPRYGEAAKKVSAPSRKPAEASALKRRAATPTEQKSEGSKTPPPKPGSKRVPKLLLVFLLLVAAGASGTLLLPRFDLMSLFHKTQGSSAVKKEIPKRPTPPTVAKRSKKRPLQTPTPVPQSPPPPKPEARSAAQPATESLPAVEAAKGSERDNASLKKAETGFLPPVEMAKETAKSDKQNVEIPAPTVPPAGMQEATAHRKEGQQGAQIKKENVKENKSGANASPPSQEEAKSYPYSVYLGSFRREDAAQKALAVYSKRGLSPYLVRMDLGAKGVWLRVYAGHFETREEADALIKKIRIPEAETKHARYAVLIGVYPSMAEAQAKMGSLKDAGCHPYIIGEKVPRIRVYTGAFYREEDAKIELTWLASKGINGKIVER